MLYMNKKLGLCVAFTTLLLLNACEDKNRILEKEEALLLIDTYMKDTLRDRSITLDGGEREVDLLGNYHGYNVAITYDKEAKVEMPNVSLEADYYMSIPKGNAAFIHSAMKSLNEAQFLPVLAQVKDLGVQAANQPIESSFTVRHGTLASCSFLDDSSRTYPGFTQPIEDQKFSLPSNTGFNLQRGEYTLECIFNDEMNLSTEEISAARFSLTGGTEIVYKHGLKDTTCIIGHKIPLKAYFSTPDSGSLEIIYYDDGSPLENQTFVCENIGKHQVQAVAVDTQGEKIVSPRFTFEVQDIPAAFFPGAKRVSTKPRVILK